MNIKKVVVIGATGATGKEWIKLLIKNKEIQKIIILARSKQKNKHPKINWIQKNLLKENNYEKYLKNTDLILCAIGTTKKKTPNKEIYKKIDLDIPIKIAKAAKKLKIKKFAIISAIGANPKSFFFYNKLKGQLEQELKKINIPQTYIFKPSLITAKRPENRIKEKIAEIILKKIKFLLPDKYKPITSKNLAKATLKYIKLNQKNKIHIIQSDIIQKYK